MPKTARKTGWGWPAAVSATTVSSPPPRPAGLVPQGPATTVRAASVQQGLVPQPSKSTPLLRTRCRRLDLWLRSFSQSLAPSMVRSQIPEDCDRLPRCKLATTAAQRRREPQTLPPFAATAGPGNYGRRSLWPLPPSRPRATIRRNASGRRQLHRAHIS